MERSRPLGVPDAHPSGAPNRGQFDNQLLRRGADATQRQLPPAIRFLSNRRWPELHPTNRYHGLSDFRSAATRLIQCRHGDGNRRHRLCRRAVGERTSCVQTLSSRPSLAPPPGADTLRVEATFKAVNEKGGVSAGCREPSGDPKRQPTRSSVGRHVGGSPRALKDYLAALGWRQVFDTLAGTGPVTVYSGAIDAHKAEVVAMFGDYSPDRLINFFVAFPAKTPEELRATYSVGLWLHGTSTLRCRAQRQEPTKPQPDQSS